MREEEQRMEILGAMEMPQGFRYRDVFRKGRPRHGRTDPFSLKHPKMEVGRRAKIFLPFDALRGFDLALAEKNGQPAPETDDADRLPDPAWYESW